MTNRKPPKTKKSNGYDENVHGIEVEQRMTGDESEPKLRPFTMEELADGHAHDDRPVTVPLPGNQFDATEMLVDAVLVLNRLQQRVEELEAKRPNGNTAPAKKDTTLQLPKLSGEYENDLE